MCPYCRTPAPLIYRGVSAVCSACGRPRGVLSADSVTYAGQPAKVGASVVLAFGWLGLLMGLGFASLLGLFVGLVDTAGTGFISFGVVALFSTIVFLLVRHGSKRLETSGQKTLENKQDQALFALAAHHGGRLHPMQAAAALDLTVDQADAVLTRLNRARPLEVEVELTDDGQIFYAFAQLRAGRRFEARPQRARFDEQPRSHQPEVLDADFEPSASAPSRHAR